MIRRRWAYVRARVANRLGHRGAALLVLGIIWLGVGMGVMSPPPVVRPDIAHIHETVPIVARLAWWLIPGTLAVVYGLLRRGHRDGLAFAALMIPVMIRLGSFTWSWVATLFVPPRAGDPDGWKAALIWGAIAALILIVSDWPEPPREDEGEAETSVPDWPVR